MPAAETGGMIWVSLDEPGTPPVFLAGRRRRQPRHRPRPKRCSRRCCAGRRHSMHNCSKSASPTRRSQHRLACTSAPDQTDAARRRARSRRCRIQRAWSRSTSCAPKPRESRRMIEAAALDQWYVVGALRDFPQGTSRRRLLGTDLTHHRHGDDDLRRCRRAPARTDYGHLWVTLGTPERALFDLPEVARARPPRRLLRRRAAFARLGPAADRELPRSRAFPLCAHRHSGHRGAAGGRQIRGRAAPRCRRALGHQMRVLPAQGRGVVRRRPDQPVHVPRRLALQCDALQDAAHGAQPLGRHRALRAAGGARCVDRPSLHAGDRRRPRPMPS